MKNIRKNSEKGKLTFYAGAIAGFHAGLLVSPIWWIVDTVGIILNTFGTGLTKAGAAVRGKAEANKEKPVDKAAEPAAAADVGNGATPAAA